MFRQLEKIVEGVRLPSKRLAVAVGDFHGTNDFANEKREMWCGFVLNEILVEMTASIVIRASALLEPPKRSTDLTLAGAADILEQPDVKAEVIERAKGRTYTNEAVAKIRASHVDRDREAFLRIVRNLDLDDLRKYRNWVLAHNTSNPKPPLTYTQVWEIAEAVLLASDHLVSVVTGDQDDVVGIAKGRRDQSLIFWQRLNERQDPSG